jgi:hypothetical protein
MDRDRTTEFEELERTLRAHRHEATPLELDQIKLRAMARTSRSRTGGTVLRTRFVTMLAVLGLMGAGTGGVLAKSGGGDEGSAAKSEYKPGKGCGDKNHEHARHDECKNKDNNGSNGGGGNDGNHGSQGGGDND